MIARRLWAGVPLAVLVAVLAHVAGFGFDHAPGGGHAAGLLGLLGAALLSGGLVAFFAAALGRAPSPAVPHAARDYGILALVAGAVLGAIELTEGHLGFGGNLRPLVALLPFAVLVAIGARRAAALIARAGDRFGAYASRLVEGTRAVFAARIPARVAIRSNAGARTTRGRAPPGRT